MARPLRIEYPGAFYHIISRGNAGDPIYKTRRDRDKFLEYLSTMVARFGVKIHTYCLMTNHYHLLVETPEPNLSRAIQWLNVSYATYFNIKRDRRGHLIQGRYKSILVDADAYIKHLSRYIHLNPKKANMVDAIADHPWSSYPAIIGKIKVPDWLTIDYLLSQFGKNRKAARRRYEQFVESVDLDSVDNLSSKVVSGLILGDNGFVNWIKTSFLSEKSPTPDIPQLRELTPKCSLDRIVEAVANEFGINKAQILAKGRKRNIARNVAIYCSKVCSGKSGVEIARHFGLRSGSAVTMRYKIALTNIEAQRELQQKVIAAKERIMNN